MDTGIDVCVDNVNVCLTPAVKSKVAVLPNVPNCWPTDGSSVIAELLCNKAI